MRFASVLALLSVSCSDGDFGVLPTPPNVQIIGADGSALVGTPITVVGRVSDDDPAEDLEVIWSWDFDEVAGASGSEPGAIPDAEGHVSWTMTPTYEGPLFVTLQVIDSDAYSGESSIRLDVGTDAAPTALVIVPADGAEVYEFGVDLVGVVDDDTTPESELVVVWASDVDGALDGITTNSDGVTTVDPDLSPGPHRITLTATDGGGRSGSAAVEITVLSCEDVDGDGELLEECGGRDCDDGEPTVYPGAPEICDDFDNDCDGTVNEGGGGRIWYLDADGDLYGDPTATIEQCDRPEDYVANGEDCDDANPLVHPDAEESDCADPIDYNCDGATGYADEDGDGWVACEECDDGDAAVHPGATETCNGADDDCDGTVDEPDATDAATWYLDADGDGYGDPGATTVACVAPTGYSALATDCDDGDAATHPGAAEDCDDPVDRNCDGSSAWEDADADGAAACLDCDDADPMALPGGTEVCDSADNDCDGTADEGAADATTLYHDGDGDGYGDPALSLVACAGLAGWVEDATDCDDLDATANPGEAEDCNGEDDDCDGLTDEDWGDSDGDGIIDCADSETCDGLDNDGDGEVDEGFGDSDGDGVADCVDIEECDGLDNDGDGDVDEGLPIGAVDWYLDDDGDGYGAGVVFTACAAPAGYVADGSDCDDDDATVYPGADEACDGLDTDCDGAVPSDEVDDDGDGAYACSGEGDCDDADATVYPGADEACDGLDNDCDGVTDEDWGDADADGIADCLDAEECDGLDNDGDGDVDEGIPTGSTAWYLDGDGDGYGAGTAFTACAAPAGYVADGSDCDDGDATVYPGAVEACDGLDTDCDGAVPSDEVDADGDGAYACSGEGDCDDADPTVYPGAPELCDGEDNNCNGEYPVGDDVDADEDGWYLCTGAVVDPENADCDDGNAAIYPGAPEECDDEDNDCNGVVDDGYSDSDGDGFVCTDCDDGDPTSYPGGIEVWDGADNDCDGVVDNQIDHDLADFCVRGEEIEDMALGTFFGSRSDFNGDGLADLVVAAPWYDPSSATTGAGFTGVFFGAAGGFSGGATEATLLDADVVILGASYGEGIWPFQVGDLDADGTDDLMVSDMGGSYYPSSGETTFFFTGIDYHATYSIGDAADSVRPSSWIGWDRGHFGGDWDGDNYPDIVSPEVVFGEHVYVIDGEQLGTLGGAYASTIADLSVWIDGAYYYGSPVSLEEDLGGLGYDDLAVACTACDEGGGTMSGAVYVFRSGGVWPGGLDQDDASTVLYAATAGDRLGWDLTSPGDIDGDGAADLLVQARDANDGDGVLYVIPGPIPTGTYEVSSVALAIETEVTSNYAFGYAPTAADLEGDGLLDLLTVRTTYDGTAFLFGGGDLVLTGGTSIVAEDGAAATFDIDTMPDSYGAAIGPDADGDGTAEIVLYGYGEMGSGYMTSESEACVFYGRNGP